MREHFIRAFHALKLSFGTLIRFIRSVVLKKDKTMHIDFDHDGQVDVSITLHGVDQGNPTNHKEVI